MAIFIARRHGFSDAIDDELAGSDSDALMVPGFVNQAPPAPALQSTGLIPISSTGPGAPASSGGSGQTWTNVFQDVVKGLFTGGASHPASSINRAPSSSTSTDTVLLVGGGLAVVGLVAYLLMRRG